MVLHAFGHKSAMPSTLGVHAQSRGLYLESVELFFLSNAKPVHVRTTVAHINDEDMLT